MLLLSAGLFFALALSAFFSVAETAFFSLSEPRIRALADEGRPGGAALVRLRESAQRLLVLLRLGDTVADVAAAVLAAAIGYQLWGVSGLVIAAGVVALLILLLGELDPLNVAADRAATVSLRLAPALLVLCRVFGPVAAVLERLARLLPGRPAGVVGAVTESEIQMTVLGHAEGAIDEHERQLIERAFRLDEIQAWDIMTPRVDIFAWKDSLRLSEIARQLGAQPYSRVPVYGESIDDITGVLYVRDAYQALVMGQRDVPLRALAREPLIVPGSVPILHLLRDFQNRRIHMAIVVDEYGGTDGLVTLEDVLEELVGEIVDEMDVAEEAIVRVSRNEIIAAGDADLREINHAFNTSLPLLEHRSLNGYLLEELGRVPEPGESIEREGILIEVLEANEMQVLRARLRRTLPVAEVIAAPEGGEPPEQVAADGGEAESSASDEERDDGVRSGSRSRPPASPSMRA
jgi:CBS domain containing-hemolysin-like protein